MKKNHFSFDIRIRDCTLYQTTIYAFVLFFLINAATLFTQAGPLFFPAEKNNIRILSQRFEYQLIDEHQFRIGDVVLDSRLMKMNFTEQDSSYYLEFSWPSSFVDQGEIAIKDPSGKALFVTQINKEQIKKSNMSSVLLEVPKYKLPEAIFYAPYLRFCIQQNNEGTKVFLCSSDFAFKKNKSIWSLRTVKNLREESFVEINGELVGPQGIITMNDPKQTLSMRALMKSGMTLEMETRLKSVEFKDFLLSNDEKNVIIRGYMGEPADEKNIRRLKNGEWEAIVPLEKPTLYLKGEGGIPLAQEFSFQGGLRKKGSSILVQGKAPEFTYSDNYKINLKTSKGLVLSSVDNNSEVSSQSDGQSTWILKDLKTPGLHRRLLKVNDGENTFFAAIEIERIKNNWIRLNLDAPLNYGIQFSSQWNAFWIPSLEWQSYTKINDIQANKAELESQWIIPSGSLDTKNLTKPYWGLGLNAWMGQMQDTQYSKSPYALGVSIHYHRRLDRFFQYLHVQAKSSAWSSSATSSSGSLQIIEAQAQWLKAYSENWSYGVELKYHSYDSKFKESDLDQNLKHSQGQLGFILQQSF